MHLTRSEFMLTPGKLKELVAEALGLQSQIKTIDVHLRNLREARLLAKAKRGRGAAEMGPEDAANLLIAVAGSELVKDSVSSVEKYGSLKIDPSSITKRGLFTRKGRARMASAWHELPLVELPPDHTFSEGLKTLLSLLAEGRFLDEEYRNGFHAGKGEWISPSAGYLLVSFYSPPHAAMLQYGFRRGFHVQLVYGELPVRDSKVADDLSNFETGGMLLKMTTIDRHALVRIAGALRRRIEDEEEPTEGVVS